MRRMDGWPKDDMHGLTDAWGGWMSSWVGVWMKKLKGLRAGINDSLDGGLDGWCGWIHRYIDG